MNNEKIELKTMKPSHFEVYHDRVGQTGRSMVEMLGVLAIIGVLSVGGIAGYTSAMNKHRANDTVQRIMRRAIIVSGQRSFGQSVSLEGYTDTGSYTISAPDITNANAFTFTVESVPEDVCERILALSWPSATINPARCSAEQDMTFTFNNDLSLRELDDGTSGGEGGQEGSGGSSGEGEDDPIPQTQEACENAGKQWCDESCHSADYTCCPNNGHHGTDGETCCNSDNYAWNEAWGNYGNVDISNCGCPPDVVNELTVRKEGNICCNSRNQKYNDSNQSYDTTDISNCGCPYDTTNKVIGEFGTDNETCCYDGKSWDDVSQQYTSSSGACGCPENGTWNETVGACCLDGKQWTGWGYWGAACP